MSKEVLDLYIDRPEKYQPLEYHPDPDKLLLESLNQGTLLAGREKPFCWELDAITSEGALHRYRAEIEIEALINMAEYGPVDIPISDTEKDKLRSLYSKDNFDSSIVKKIDQIGYNGQPPKEHDVKSVVTYCAQLFQENELGHLTPYLHLGMTSEDTNNLAFNLMLRDATNKVVIPAIKRVADRLAHFAVKFADSPTLGKTHAQKASPTTIGKQFGYLLSNITEVINELDGMRLSGKFSGAVGNHNPFTVLFPSFDYDQYAKEFVESLGFTYATIENQRNDHIAVTRLLSTLSRLSVVGKDATDNIWLKILDNQMGQQLISGEIGSSTMSHKINPWRLENSEALAEQAISLMHGAPEGLIASRHERDLSDHGWERAYGDIIGRVVASYNYFSVQLDRLSVDEFVAGKVYKSSEVLSELIQTAGSVLGDPDAYEKVIELTQGRELNYSDIIDVINKVLPDGEIKERVSSITPNKYVGIAGQLARKSVLSWHASKLILSRGVLDESTSIDAVLFDFDGTLHFGDKEELFARLDAITKSLHMNLTSEEIREIGDRSDFREMRSLLANEYNRRYPHTPITEADIQAANDAVSGSFDNMFYAADDALLSIESIRASGKKTGLVTTRGNKSRDRLLRHHRFEELFDEVIGRDDAERRKPHPQPIAIALEKLGIKPNRALYVGDLQIDDIGAGNALGMKTAMISRDPLDPHGPTPTYHWQNLKPLVRLYGR